MAPRAIAHSALERLFNANELRRFDFSEAPTLIRGEAATALAGALIEEEDIALWQRAQSMFLGWTADRRRFSRDYIETAKRTYDEFFQRRGLLEGGVLDIGGGWGLFREWWQPGDSGVFVVHDPGVERFLRGPYQLHREYYQRALGLPMTFVEGYGEALPYADGVFDVCLIASALDHCIDPATVLNQAHRCLRPRGTLLLILGDCHTSRTNMYVAYFAAAARYLRHPGSLFHAILRFLRPDPHMHHFSSEQITVLLKQSGFSEVTVTPVMSGVHAFEALR